MAERLRTQSRWQKFEDATEFLLILMLIGVVVAVWDGVANESELAGWVIDSLFN